MSCFFHLALITKAKNLEFLYQTNFTLNERHTILFKQESHWKLSLHTHISFHFIILNLLYHFNANWKTRNCGLNTSIAESSNQLQLLRKNECKFTILDDKLCLLALFVLFSFVSVRKTI